MRRRTTAAVAATTVLAAGVATAAAGRRARTARPGGARLTVRATAAGRVMLSRTPDSLRPGTFALTSPACHAVTGPVLDVPTPADAVVRRLERVTRGELRPRRDMVLTPQLYEGDPGSALGLDYADVEVSAEGGPLPAWFVPGPRDTWIVALHGLRAGREQVLNVLPSLSRQQFPVLVPACRAASAHPVGLGGEDWRAADAAFRYALRFGARRVVLYGWSSGATMALHAVARSPLSGRVAGLVLDSPVLRPAVTLQALGARGGAPGPLRRLVPRLLRRPGPAPGAGEPPAAPPPGQPLGPRGAPLPVLVLHGPDDGLAPYADSRRLAERHPESVVLHTVQGAGHAALWNAAPEAYEETLRRFLTPLT